MRAAGYGNRTVWCPSRLVVNPGGVAAPSSINLAQFALVLAIRKWPVLNGPKSTKMCANTAQPCRRGGTRGHVSFDRFAQISRAIRQGPSLGFLLAGFFEGM